MTAKKAQQDKQDPRIDKRRVTMTNLTAQPDGSVAKLVATDYVRPDLLDAYVEDARQRWQLVEVSEVPDAGPGGYDGDTHIPEHLAAKVNGANGNGSR